MIKSIQKYLGNIIKLSQTQSGRQFLARETGRVKNIKQIASTINQSDLRRALDELAFWFQHNQQQMNDDGFGTFYFNTGWTSSYPETTGYIIPSLLEYASLANEKEFEKIAFKALDWLLDIQKPSGGWQSGYIHQNRDEIVFNTGQVLRGLVAGYHHSKNQKYLDAAVKACHWLVSIQAENGSFDKHVYLNQARVYDSYVVAPMLEVYEICKEESFRNSAIKNIEWIIQEKQLANGWFEDCDNTVHKNDRPILHTISYTIDGILDCAIILKDNRFLKAAQKPADEILNQFLNQGLLKGRYDRNWKGSEELLTTGCAQISIIWEKLYKQTKEERYKTGYTKMNKLLVAIQQRNVEEKPDTKGAIFGSFPFWGRYESFGCPNWASKYMMDSLMFELKNT